MASRQIGVGFMLLWNIGPDWGLFGYLGASATAWSYDPSTGDVVSATKSIQMLLPLLGFAVHLEHTPLSRVGWVQYVMGNPAGVKRDFEALEKRRREAIRLVTVENLNQSEAARQVKVVRQTVGRWVREYRENGGSGTGKS